MKKEKGKRKNEDSGFWSALNFSFYLFHSQKEQPSPGCVSDYLLERRNIVLSQSDELNSTLLDHWKFECCNPAQRPPQAA